jgi:aspartate racemase
MKKIGIIGGVGWPSTVEYYGELCRRAVARYQADNLAGTPAMPEMSIESLNLRKAIQCIGSEDEASWSSFDEYHRAALRRLEAGGADFALIASISAHHRFASIVRGATIPVIDAIDVVARACAHFGIGQVLLLGTALTMASSRVRAEFARHGVEAAGPSDEAARSEIVDVIGTLQLCGGEGAAQRLGRIAARAFGRRFAGASAVCLACTELPLAFPNVKSLATFEIDGVTYLNATAMHVDAAFALACGD